MLLSELIKDLSVFSITDRLEFRHKELGDLILYPITKKSDMHLPYAYNLEGLRHRLLVPKRFGSYNNHYLCLCEQSDDEEIGNHILCLDLPDVGMFIIFTEHIKGYCRINQLSSILTF